LLLIKFVSATFVKSVATNGGFLVHFFAHFSQLNRVMIILFSKFWSRANPTVTPLRGMFISRSYIYLYMKPKLSFFVWFKSVSLTICLEVCVFLFVFESNWALFKLAWLTWVMCNLIRNSRGLVSAGYRCNFIIQFSNILGQFSINFHYIQVPTLSRKLCCVYAVFRCVAFTS